MAEKRSERRARKAELGWVETEPTKQSLSQRHGETFTAGDAGIAATAVSALHQRGKVERATHHFHTYPAGLHPDAAALLLTIGGGHVLDPFCGGGTVLVEALLAGRNALGCDISPVANLVARARTALTTEEERTAMRVAARKAAEFALRPAAIPDDVPDILREWYAPHVLAEMCTLLARMGDSPLIRAVFSSIAVKTSERESDTSNRRVAVARPVGTAATLFHRRAREYGRQLEALAAAVPEGVRARVHREDAREIRAPGEFGMVLTSPPYPGVYDYVPMQQLRMTWLGLDARDAPRAEIGSRRAFRADRATAILSWREDTSAWVKSCARALVSGGRMIVVIGDGTVGGKRIDAFTPVDECARLHGLTFLARATVERWDEGALTMRPEHAMVYERP